MTGRNWTELFFLDEAVAFAAGHRPCGYCRRAAYQRYVTAWTNAAGGRPSARDMDRALHQARVMPRRRVQQTYRSAIADLPPGAMIVHDDRPYLLGCDRMYPYQPTGYLPAIDRPVDTDTTVLTPQPTVAVLRAGYCPALHPSATL